MNGGERERERRKGHVSFLAEARHCATVAQMKGALVMG